VNANDKAPTNVYWLDYFRAYWHLPLAERRESSRLDVASLRAWLDMARGGK
jgi:hypothetical protein